MRPRNKSKIELTATSVSVVPTAVVLLVPLAVVSSSVVATSTTTTSSSDGANLAVQVLEFFRSNAKLLVVSELFQVCDGECDLLGAPGLA